MSDGKGVVRFEAAPVGESVPTLFFIAGILGSVINVGLWFSGFNLAWLGTVSGLLVCLGLVIRWRLPRSYELRGDGLTIYYRGRHKSIRWDEVDLILSTSSLKSRGGETVQLVPVRAGQDEFNRRLLEGLGEQIEFEAEWRRYNTQAISQSPRFFGALIIAYSVLSLLFIISSIWNQSEIAKEITWILMFGFQMLNLPIILMAKPNIEIDSEEIKSKNWTISMNKLMRIKIGIDGVSGTIYPNDNVDETKVSLIDCLIFVKTMAALSPDTPLNAERRVLEILQEPHVVDQKTLPSKRLASSSS